MMGAQFLDDTITRESINSTFKVEYNQTSFEAPRPRSSKHEGPLIANARNSFNSFASTSCPTREISASVSSPKRDSSASGIPTSPVEEHPLDSPPTVPYYAFDSAITDSEYLHPSSKMVVTRAGVVQLILRCLEFVGGLGLLGMTMLISNIPSITGWIIRIPPGVALIHTAYSIYHFAGRSSRPPGSSASYMFVAAFLDASLIPFCVFTAILSESQHKMPFGSVKSTNWSSLLGSSFLPKFSEATFLLAVITGGLHLISLVLSLSLAAIFRKINNLPPDMNPLEKNPMSHRTKSKAMIINLSADELRLSQPLEGKRRSGAVYENLSREPTIPSPYTRPSIDSSSSYHSTPPPSRSSQSQSPSRDLLTRQYQREASYTVIPLSDDSPQPELTTIMLPPKISKRDSRHKETWFASDSFGKSQKPAYEPISMQSFEEFGLSSPSNSPHTTKSHSTPTQSSVLLERNLNRDNKNRNAELSLIREESADYSSMEIKRTEKIRTSDDGTLKGKYYGDLRAGTPPIMVGARRQTSTGADVEYSCRVLERRREASGKTVEEGRSGWLRRASGRIL